MRLQFDNVRQKWVVLVPERVLWPDEISVDILERCDGKQDIASIVSGLATEYGADISEVETDVLEFLQGWSDQRLLSSEA